MGRFFVWLRTDRWRLYLFAAFIVFVIGNALFAGGVTVWEYTNSPQFCGTTCHAMPPEYTAYQVSPHARVPCVDCHLGQESVLMAVPRKAKEIRHVVFALTQRYEVPVYVKSLRPARDTCEKCHYPEKFSTDSVREIRRYARDAENTETRIYLVMKTGGGSKREGLGRGIHWHIENEVWYIATDPLKQEIPYVRQVDDDGRVTEYFDVSVNLPSDFVAQNSSKLHRMDCIDCHTRISHLFRSPDRAMDQALARRLIDRDIPSIKLRGLELLEATYSSHEEAIAAIQQLDQWYRTNYPEWYNDALNQARLKSAIAQLQRIYEQTVFPDMGVGWQTHPDNVGHAEFPGCFRCHDGKHVSPQQTTIRLECNICHSIPEVVVAGQSAPAIALEKPGEPASHLDSNWLARHRFEFDQTCATCHDIANAGGSDNSSFCSNSACHATEWKYVGLNAPAIRKLSEPVKEKEATGPAGVPPQVPHPIGPRTDCKLCHGPDKVRPYPENHAGFDVAICTNCHPVISTELTASPESIPTPMPTPEQATATPGPAQTPQITATSVPTVTQEPTATSLPATRPAGVPPDIPHALEGRDDCLVCHAVDSAVKPAPANHTGRTNDTCRACHKPAAPSTPTPTATPTPEVASVSFQKDVLPVFKSKCSACHGSIKGLALTSFVEVMKGGENGPVVVPGDAEASLLVQKQRGEHTVKLSEAELQAVINWINAGAPDN